MKRSTAAKRGNSSKSNGNGHQGKPDIDRLMQEGTEIDRAINRAVREAILTHKKLGQPIVVWKNGKVVWLKPEEIK